MGFSRFRRRVTLMAGVGAALSGMTFAQPVAADSLTKAEIERIGRGETVVRSETVEMNGRRYVGGVTYTVIEATAEELLEVMEDSAAYLEVLPRAKFAERIHTREPIVLMEMHHGNALVDAAYTMRLEKETDKTRVRFSIDKSRPHDIEDAWGYFRYSGLPTEQGAPRVLLTYGVLADLGKGALRSLYEDRVKTAMLSVPQLLRSYVKRTLRKDS